MRTRYTPISLKDLYRETSFLRRREVDIGVTPTVWEFG